MPEDQSDLKFGRFVLSPSARRLVRDGVEVSLTPKAFDTLAYLVTRTGEVIGKQELMKAVWQDVFVDDSTLTQNIFTIRKALEDASYIETIPRKGYRFTTAVVPVGAAGKAGRRVPWLGTGIAALISLVTLISGVAFWRANISRSSPAKIRSIAVLPLRNLSGDPEQEYFSDGTTEALITDLAQIHSLDVTSRTSVMHYKGTTETATQIGRELGVDAIVEGAVQKSGGRVRITAQLIRAATDKHLWASEYERDIGDVLKLEAEVAQAIAREIQAHVTPEETGRLASARTVTAEAQEQYLLARHSFWRADYPRAIEHFEKAVQLQPDYALAYAGLAQSWQRLYNAKPSPEARAGSRNASLKAIELDPNLADSHAAMGAELFGEWDWAASERELRRALELDPNSLFACQCLGNLMILLGRTAEATAFFERGRRADPLSASMWERAGALLYASRRYQEAIPYFLRALELDPHYRLAHIWLARAYEKLNRLPEALAVLNVPEFRSSTELARAYAIMGRRTEALKILDSLTKPGGTGLNVEVAYVYFILGDRDRGFQWLGKSMDRRETTVGFVKFSPDYDDVRSDPRFQELVTRLKIPERDPQ